MTPLPESKNHLPIQEESISKKPSTLIKAIRVFLLILIVIGLGLIGTYKLWMPKLVNILEPAQSMSVTATSTVIETLSPHWVTIDPAATSSIPDRVAAVDYQIFATKATSTYYCFARDTNARVIYSVGASTPTPITGVDYASFIPLDVINAPSDSYSGCYSKDKNKVHWFTWQEEGVIVGANPATFTTDARTYPWARDAEHVYFLSSQVANADPVTFEAIPKSDYGKDKNHIFYHYGYGTTVLVVSAVPEMFQPFPPAHLTATDLKDENSLYGKDSTNIYCKGVILTGADMRTFSQIDLLDAKDKNHTYTQCDVYDPNTAP